MLTLEKSLINMCDATDSAAWWWLPGVNVLFGSCCQKTEADCTRLHNIWICSYWGITATRKINCLSKKKKCKIIKCLYNEKILMELSGMVSFHFFVLKSVFQFLLISMKITYFIIMEPKKLYRNLLFFEKRCFDWCMLSMWKL